MDISRSLQSAFWNVLPAAAFHPKEGMKTTEKMTLTERPALTSEDRVKFAVFSDIRFYKEHLYKKLLPFLPQEFDVVDGPNGQNCFMHCLNIDPKKKPFGRPEFNAELERQKYQWFPYKATKPEPGDIIVYSIEGFIDSIREHAGIYVGDDRVRSRWGEGSPLIEHPLKEVIPNYWNGNDEYLTVERKT